MPTHELNLSHMKLGAAVEYYLQTRQENDLKIDQFHDAVLHRLLLATSDEIREKLDKLPLIVTLYHLREETKLEILSDISQRREERQQVLLEIATLAVSLAATHS